ncbi:MAG: hypothetical protein KJ718_01045 [Nanoarchaeota archaeon]|nr:hypothetical protein [Nanoarchaeota archaeon]
METRESASETINPRADIHRLNNRPGESCVVRYFDAAGNLTRVTDFEAEALSGHYVIVRHSVSLIPGDFSSVTKNVGVFHIKKEVRDRTLEEARKYAETFRQEGATIINNAE